MILQGISLPSPLGEGLGGEAFYFWSGVEGMAFYFFLSAFSPHFH